MRIHPTSVRRLLLTAGIVLGVLGITIPAYAIANGTPVPEGRYRFAVKLTMTNIPRPDGTHYNSGCSAGLIAPRWIISAGHCFHDVDRNPVSGPVPYQTVATIGRTDDADTNGHVFNVTEDYQSPSNDIAIAKLDRSVIDIVPLRLSNVVPQLGWILRIAGWGSLTDVNPSPASHLQAGQLQITSVAAATMGLVGSAPQPDTTPCLYDSGAPYFLEPAHGSPILVGVESGGPDCPHTLEETVGRVDVVNAWIRSTMAAHRGNAT
jgi:secreted trypsin-like serine protease